MTSKKKELVYICSPLSAPTHEGIKNNMNRAREYMKEVSEMYDCRAVAPHAILPAILDDTVSEERVLGLNFGLDLLRLCKKIVVCGTVISSGMKNEIALAKELGIEIIYKDMPSKHKLRITIEIEGDKV